MSKALDKVLSGEYKGRNPENILEFYLNDLFQSLVCSVSEFKNVEENGRIKVYRIKVNSSRLKGVKSAFRNKNCESISNSRKLHDYVIGTITIGDLKPDFELTLDDVILDYIDMSKTRLKEEIWILNSTILGENPNLFSNQYEQKGE